MTIFDRATNVRHEVSFISASPSFARMRCGLRVPIHKGKPPLKEATVTCLECIAARPSVLINIGPTAVVSPQVYNEAMRIMTGRS